MKRQTHTVEENKMILGIKKKTSTVNTVPIFYAIYISVTMRESQADSFRKK